MDTRGRALKDVLARLVHTQIRTRIFSRAPGEPQGEPGTIRLVDEPGKRGLYIRLSDGWHRLAIPDEEVKEEPQAKGAKG